MTLIRRKPFGVNSIFDDLFDNAQLCDMHQLEKAGASFPRDKHY